MANTEEQKVRFLNASKALSTLPLAAFFVMFFEDEARAQETWPVSLLDINWSIPEADVSTAEYVLYEPHIFGIICRGCPGSPMFIIEWQLENEFAGAIPPLVMPAQSGSEAIYLSYCQIDFAGGVCSSEAGQLFDRSMVDITATRPANPSLDWSPTNFRVIYIDFGDTRLTLDVASLSADSAARWTEHLLDVLEPYLTELSQ